MACLPQPCFHEFDSEYLQRLQKRDPETELHFFSYFTPRLERRLRRFLNSLEKVEDAKQETFARVLRIVRKHNGVRQPDRFGAFVYALCDNVVREMRRQEKKFIPLEQGWKGPNAICRHAVRNAEVGEARVFVRQVLDRMPAFDRRLLQAVFLDEEDKPELCRRYGITRAHLRVLLHRAKRRFIAHLERRRSAKAYGFAGSRQSASMPSPLQAIATARSARTPKEINHAA
jgi:RNA polymerase sigma-70 factor (ECF subfamily)